jgi:hypothetical protein
LLLTFSLANQPFFIEKVAVIQITLLIRLEIFPLLCCAALSKSVDQTFSRIAIGKD